MFVGFWCVVWHTVCEGNGRIHRKIESSRKRWASTGTQVESVRLEKGGRRCHQPMGDTTPHSGGVVSGVRGSRCAVNERMIPNSLGSAGGGDGLGGGLVGSAEWLKISMFPVFWEQSGPMCVEHSALGKNDRRQGRGKNTGRAQTLHQTSTDNGPRANWKETIHLVNITVYCDGVELYSSVN